jgi:hypothetical protein
MQLLDLKMKATEFSAMSEMPTRLHGVTSQKRQFYHTHIQYIAVFYCLLTQIKEAIC